MIKTYKKDCDYSYTLGVFLTIELLKFKPRFAYFVAVSEKAKDSDGVKKVIELCNKNNIKYEINDKQIENLSPKENCYAIGFFKKYENIMNKNNNHIVLVNPSDAGNLGTIMRTALGFNTTDLVIIKPAVDVFEPKCVRASMGAIFHIDFVYYESFEVYQKAQLNNRKYYPFMLGASIPLTKLQPKKPYSFIFGNEATGLPKLYENVGECVVIKHSDLIDSLNLQTAVSISLFYADSVSKK